MKIARTVILTAELDPQEQFQTARYHKEQRLLVTSATLKLYGRPGVRMELTGPAIRQDGQPGRQIVTMMYPTYLLREAPAEVLHLVQLLAAKTGDAELLKLGVA